MALWIGHTQDQNDWGSSPSTGHVSDKLRISFVHPATMGTWCTDQRLDHSRWLLQMATARESTGWLIIFIYDHTLTLTVLVTTIDALRHFETG